MPIRTNDSLITIFYYLNDVPRTQARPGLWCFIVYFFFFCMALWWHQYFVAAMERISSERITTMRSKDFLIFHFDAEFFCRVFRLKVKILVKWYFLVYRFGCLFGLNRLTMVDFVILLRCSPLHYICSSICLSVGLSMRLS